MSINFHESLLRQRGVEIGSNRAFGYVMAVACLIIAGLGFWTGSTRWPIWVTVAFAFAGTAWLWPSLLHPLNRAWFRLGLLLHRIVNPLVMGFLFFLVITPVGLLMRLCGKRPLGLEFQGDETTYWTMRDKSPPGPMAKQY